MVTPGLTNLQGKNQDIDFEWYNLGLGLCHFVAGVDLCNHHHNQDAQLFITVMTSLMLPFYSHPAFIPFPQPLANPNILSTCMFFAF
jgi:hypothetical protein